MSARVCLLCAVLLLLTGSPGLAQERVCSLQLTDGEIVSGRFVEYRNNYWVLEVSGRILRIADRKVMEVLRAPGSLVARTVDEPTKRQELYEVERLGDRLGRQSLEDVLQVPTQLKRRSEAILGTNSFEAAQVFQEALAAEEKENYLRAIEAYEAAINLDPWFRYARLGLVRSLVKDRDYVRAEEELGHLLECWPEEIDALRLKQVVAERTDRVGESMAIQELLLSRTLPQREVEYLMAHEWMRTGNLQKAQYHWDRYRAEDPLLQAYFCREGLLLREVEQLAQHRRYREAIRELRNVATLNPLLRRQALDQEKEAREAMVQDLIEEDQLLEAIDEYGALLQLCPEREVELRQAILDLELDRFFITRRLQEGRLRRAFAEVERLVSVQEWGAALGQVCRQVRGRIGSSTQAGELGPLVALLEDIAESSLGATQAGELAQALSHLQLHVSEVLRQGHLVEEALQAYDAATKWNPALAETRSAFWRTVILEHGKWLFAEAHYSSAMETFAELVEVDCEDGEALGWRDQAAVHYLSEQLVSEGASRATRLEALEEFLRQGPSDKYAEWAERELARLLRLEKVEQVRKRVAARKYFPLRPEARYEYLFSDGRTWLREVVSVVEEEAGRRAQVLDTIQRREAEWSRAVTYFDDGTRLWQLQEDRKEVLFEYPIEADHSWEWKSGAVVFRRSYSALGLEVVMADGRRYQDCLEVTVTSTLQLRGETVGEPLVSRYYYAPQLGLLRAEVGTRRDREGEIIELVKHR